MHSTAIAFNTAPTANTNSFISKSSNRPESSHAREQTHTLACMHVPIGNKLFAFSYWQAIPEINKLRFLARTDKIKSLLKLCVCKITIFHYYLKFFNCLAYSVIWHICNRWLCPVTQRLEGRINSPNIKYL